MPKNPEVKFTFQGYEFKLTEYDYIPGSPGHLTGPPENCFPPEPSELEIVKLMIEDITTTAEDGYKEIPIQAVDLLLELHDGIWDAAMDAVEDALRKEEPEYEPRDSNPLD